MPLSSSASISGVAAAHDVADHDDVGLQLQLLRVVAFDQLDAQRGSWSDIGG